MIGTCYLVSDPQMLQSLYNTARIICITDSPEYMNNPNLINASVLMPPYDAMAAQIDGKPNVFMELYNSYLALNEANQMLTIILKAVFSGTNVILFIPKDEAALFSIALLQYIFNVYGVVVGTDTVQFGYSENSLAIIEASAYQFDIVDKIEVLQVLPFDVRYLSYITPKLMMEMNLPLNNASIEYTKMLWNEVHNSGSIHEKIKPISIGGKKV